MSISPSLREQALIRLVETHEQELLRLCCMYLGDAHLAQDAVQETFLKAYRHLDGFLGKCSEKTWLTHIALNTCRDMKRQRWFRFIDQSQPFENLPESTSECTQEQTDLALDIMRLPPKYKEVILLRYYQQMSLDEIADALRIAKALPSV